MDNVRKEEGKDEGNSGEEKRVKVKAKPSRKKGKGKRLSGAAAIAIEEKVQKRTQG